MDVYVFVCQREREIADFGSVSSYFQSPSMQLAMKRPNMESHNVCFSIIKKCLAALHVWEVIRNSGEAMKSKLDWNTCARPSAACRPEVVSDYNDIAAFWLHFAA